MLSLSDLDLLGCSVAPFGKLGSDPLHHKMKLAKMEANTLSRAVLLGTIIARAQ